MNRVLNTFVLTVSLFFALAFAVQAAEGTANTTLEVGEVTVYQGVETVEVPICVSNNQGIISVLANITYDPALTLVGIKNEELIKTSYCGTGTANLSQNPYRIYFSDSLNTEDITENGKLVTLTFSVPADAEIGTEYAISVSDGKAYNADVEKMPLEYKAGKVTVIENKINVAFKGFDGEDLGPVVIKYGEVPTAPTVPVKDMGDGTGRVFVSWDTDLTAIERDTVVTAQYREFLFGDANKDGELSLLDGVVFARYIANWKGYDDTAVDTVAADVNLDGKPESDDNIIILRYIANWSGYEKLPHGN